MKLYCWNRFIIEGKNYTIFSFAENKEGAKKLAMDKIHNKQARQIAFNLITQNEPTVFDTPSSFIWGTDCQLSI